MIYYKGPFIHCFVTIMKHITIHYKYISIHYSYHSIAIIVVSKESFHYMNRPTKIARNGGNGHVPLQKKKKKNPMIRASKEDLLP